MTDQELRALRSLAVANGVITASAAIYLIDELLKVRAIEDEDLPSVGAAAFGGGK